MLKSKMRFLVLSMVMISMLAFSFAYATSDYTDIDNHWAQSEVEQWSNLGIIKGFEGLFRPDDNITRGEMAVILDRILQYVDKAENKFVDLPQDFYTDAILKANYVGVMLGDAYTPQPVVRPVDNITRQEAVVMICRALSIEESTKENKFTDKDEMADYAIGYINAMTEKGYINGYGDTFKPLDNITRAEVVKILDNTIAKIYNVEGTYTEDIEGLVIINTPNVRLKGMTIKGDLIISEGVGDKEVYLEDITVKGDVYARGGGENSVYILGNSNIQNIVISKNSSGGIRISVDDGSTVKEINVDKGESIILTGNLGIITLNADADINLVDAKLDSLNVKSDDAKISIDKKSEVKDLVIDNKTNLEIKGNVDNLQINKDAAETQINIAGTGKVDAFVTDAKVSVNNDGEINKATVNANEVVISGDKPKTVDIDKTVDVKPVDDKGTEVPATPTPKPSSGGGSSRPADKTAPTVEITCDLDDVTNPEAIMYTLKFSEEVTGFDIDDITVTGGTKGTLTKINDTEYKLDVIISEAIQTVTVEAESCTDLAGNKIALTTKTETIGADITADADFTTARDDDKKIFILNNADGQRNALVLANDFTLANGERLLIPSGKYIYIQDEQTITLQSGSIVKLFDGTSQVLAQGEFIIDSGASVMVQKEGDYFKYIGNDENSFYKLTNGTATISVVNTNKMGITLNGNTILQKGGTLRNTEQICSGDELTIRDGKTLTIAPDTVLEILSGGKLTVEENASIVNNGTVNIYGEIHLSDTNQLTGNNSYIIDTTGTNNGAMYVGVNPYIKEAGAVVTLVDGTASIKSNENSGATVEIITGEATINSANQGPREDFEGYYLIGVKDEYKVNTNASLKIADLGDDFLGVMLTGTLEIAGTAHKSLDDKIYSNKNAAGNNIGITSLKIEGVSYSPTFGNSPAGTKYSWNGSKWDCVAKSVNVTLDLATKTTELFSKFYNKSKDTALTPTDAQYYIQVASGLATTPTSVKIGSEVFDTENVDVSMGNDNHIKLPAWKIVEGNLLIAIPILSLESSPSGKVSIDIDNDDSTEIIVTVSNAGTQLSVVSATALGTIPSEYTNTVEYTGGTVTQTIDHGHGYLGILLNDGTNDITDVQKVFTKKIYEKEQGATSLSYGVTETEGKENATIGFYAAGYKDGAFSVDEVKVRNIEYTVAVVGKGTVTIPIVVNKTAKEAI